MSLINRDAMLVFPKKPLYDWQNKIFPEDPIDMEHDPFGNENGNVYLIPEMSGDAQFEKWIRKNYAVFFEELLFQWCTNESLWPAKKNYKMFREWFYISYQSLVRDTMDTLIEKDEDYI